MKRILLLFLGVFSISIYGMDASSATAILKKRSWEIPTEISSKPITKKPDTSIYVNLSLIGKSSNTELKADLKTVFKELFGITPDFIEQSGAKKLLWIQAKITCPTIRKKYLDFIYHNNIHQPQEDE